MVDVGQTQGSAAEAPADDQGGHPDREAAEGASGERKAASGRDDDRAGTKETGEEVDDAAFALRFDCLSSVGYHSSRELFFDRLNKFLTGTQVGLQTAAVAAIIGKPDSQLGIIVALISALAGVFSLVIDPAKMAREHRSLRTRCHEILAELEERTPTMTVLGTWRARKQRISADGPPSYRAAQALAYNQAVDSIYEEPDATAARLVVPDWHRRLSQWWPYRGERYRPPKPIS
jgi:hypothetical protein